MQHEKKVMILGAGRGQVPIINLAKESGFKTIVVSVQGDYPGFKLADKIYHIDILDKEKVLGAARKEQVDGLIADQIDIAVPSVAYVTEKMGLPSIGYDCSLKFTNKFLMRNECERLNIKIPQYSKVSTLDEARKKCFEIGLPVVVKPTDSAGSKGVSLIRDICQLDEKFNNALHLSKNEYVMIEQYIEGDEYLVDGFVSNYKAVNLAIAERKYFSIPDIFVPSQTLYRPIQTSVENDIFNLNKRLIQGFGLKFGVTHSEYLVEKKTGDIYLVEVAARGGGTYISSDLIPLATGVNVNQLLLDIVVGNKDDVKITNIEDNVSGYLCFYLPDGVVKEIKGVDKVTSLPNIHRCFLDNIYVGMKTKTMTDKSMRMGPILLKGKDKEQYHNAISEIKKLLEITVETSDGMKNILW